MKNLMLIAGFCLAAGQVMAQSADSPATAPSSWDGYYIGLAVTSGEVSGPEGTTNSDT